VIPLRIKDIPPLGWLGAVGFAVLAYGLWHVSDARNQNMASQANFPAWTASHQPPENTQYQTLDMINPEASRVLPVPRDGSGAVRWTATAAGSGGAAMTMGPPLHNNRPGIAPYSPFTGVSYA
jgi:hypothetical protein